MGFSCAWRQNRRVEEQGPNGKISGIQPTAIPVPAKYSMILLTGRQEEMKVRFDSVMHLHTLETTVQKKSWTCPDFEEVSLGCEINCYAPAEL
jgi:coenzyme PQQ precursor peptide PqqA